MPQSPLHTSDKVEATLWNATSRTFLSTKSNKSNMFKYLATSRTIEQQVAVEAEVWTTLSKFADVFARFVTYFLLWHNAV